MLLINNQEVEKLFDMKSCLEAVTTISSKATRFTGRAWMFGCLAIGRTAITAGAPWKERAGRSAYLRFG